MPIDSSNHDGQRLWLHPKVYLGLLIAAGAFLFFWNGGVAVKQRVERANELRRPVSQRAGLLTSVGASIIDGSFVFFPAIIDSGNKLVWINELGATVQLRDLTNNQQASVRLDTDGALQHVRHSPKGNYLFIHQEEPASSQIVRLADQASFALPAAVTDVDWSPDETELYYLYRQAANHHQLTKAEPDGKNWRILMEKISMNDPELRLAPNGEEAIVSSRSSIAPNLLVYLRTGTTESIGNAGSHSNVVWASDSKLIAYLTHDTQAEQTGKLSYFDFTTMQETVTDYATWPNAFAWEQPDTLLVATPDAAASTAKLIRTKPGTKEATQVMTLRDQEPTTVMASESTGRIFIMKANVLAELTFGR